MFFIKQYFCSLLLFLGAVDSFAQNFQTQSYQQKEKVKPYDVILGTSGNNCYTARASGASIIIEAHDSTLAETKQATFTSVKYQGINFYFYNYAFIKGNLYLFFSGKHNTKDGGSQLFMSLIATKIDLGTLQTIGDPRMITEGDGVPILTVDEDDPGSDYIGFATKVSPNEEFLLITYVQNSVTKIIVTDEFFNWIWGSKYEYSFSDILEDIELSNDASVAMLYPQTTVMSDENNFDTQPWVMVKLTKDTLIKSILNSRGYKLFHGRIGFGNDDKPFAVGSLWFQYTPNAGLYPTSTIQRNVGTFFYFLQDTGLKMYLFDPEFIMKYKSDGDKRTIRKDIGRGAKAGDEGIFSTQVLRTDRGRIIFIGEENWGSTPISIQGLIQFSTNALDMHLIVTQFDSSGKLLNTSWVLKNQVQSEYSTFLASTANDSLYILFNDDMTNIKKTNMNEGNDTRFRSPSASVPVLVSVGASGEMNKIFPFAANPNSAIYMRGLSVTRKGEFILQRNINSKTNFDILKLK